jgi:hypothetical protein
MAQELKINKLVRPLADYKLGIKYLIISQRQTQSTTYTFFQLQNIHQSIKLS